MQMCRLFVKAPGVKAQAVVTMSISRKMGNLCLWVYWFSERKFAQLVENGSGGN